MMAGLRFKFFRKVVWFKNTPLGKRLWAELTHSYTTFVENNSRIRNQLLRFIPFLAASAISGLLAVLYYKLFGFSEKIFIRIFELEPLSIFLLTPLAFLFSWWLVDKFAPYAKGSGIPQVMAAIELSRSDTRPLIARLLSLKIILIKILSSMVKIMGGGILGREGPTIQIASSIFVSVYRILPAWWIRISQRDIMIAGAASGLAAAFNTPLGGIIFAIEELSKFQVKSYKPYLFVAVIIAGLTAQGLGGSYLYLGYPKLDANGWKVLLGVMLAAFMAGYAAAKTGRLLLQVMGWIQQKRRLHKKMIIVGCALLVAIPIYFVGIDVVGSGKELMDRILFSSDKSLPWYVPILRISGLVATFSFGGAGGIFAPSLSAGASIGALISGLLDLGDGQANLIILIGMTAFLSGITRAPFTSAIVVFEMTDRHSVIFYLMLGAVLANSLARYIEPISLYERLKETYLTEMDVQAPAKASKKSDKMPKNDSSVLPES